MSGALPPPRPQPAAHPSSKAALAATVAAGLLLLVLLRACGALPPAARRHDEIVAAGVSVHAGTPVVLWSDPLGYDAYRERKFFAAEPVPDGRRRFAPLRGDLDAALAARVQQRGWTLADLQQVVHLFVLHYDACGTSRQCFKVLHDVRFLSVHFLLDVDGTIYQTLDLQEQAFHATIANSGSIGVEIAHPGCWPQPRHPEMLRWYEQDAQGWRMRFLAAPGETGVRTPDFVPRPDRPEPVDGLVHGVRYWQLDYTPQQYRALAHLCAAVHRAFPRVRLEVPRAPDGSVRTTQLSRAELSAFEGLVGHFHVQEDKQDPGPALQWDRVLADARRIAADGGT
jgi:N-acetyl-anhydromuramyl-L-alanine amidase AmpD